MSIFVYKARNKRGQLVEGAVEAASEEVVANLLNDKALTIINIEKRDTLGLHRYRLTFLRSVKSKQLVVFFRQFSVMVQANLPIIKSLRILIKQTENKRLKEAIVGITGEIEGGARLSDAMANYPEIFSDFFVNLIKSGETSGRLAEVMEYIAEQQEKDYELQSQIKGAMIYPAFI
ncbi:MAG TPA: type II secretion system F family protein, partial [bacterium]|nr:type II secretion system F family protein [bacterium]